MAAQLRDAEEESWSQQTVSRAGLLKLMQAVEKPKAPTAKLRQMMQDHRDEKKK